MAHRISWARRRLLLALAIQVQLSSGCARAPIRAPNAGPVGLPARAVFAEKVPGESGTAMISVVSRSQGTTSKCPLPCRIDLTSGPTSVSVTRPDGSLHAYAVDVPPGASRFALSYRSRGTARAALGLTIAGLSLSAVCSALGAFDTGLAPILGTCGPAIVLLTSGLIATGVAGHDVADYQRDGEPLARSASGLRLEAVGLGPTQGGGWMGSVALRF